MDEGQTRFLLENFDFLMTPATWRRISSEITDGNLKRAGSMLLTMDSTGITLEAMAQLKPLERTDCSEYFIRVC